MVYLFIVLEYFDNIAKSLFFDVALNVNKIDQKGSKGAPGMAQVILTRVSRSPRVPSGGVRESKPPRIITQIIDKNHVYTRL